MFVAWWCGEHKVAPGCHLSRPRSKRKLATFVFSVASGIRKGEEVGSVGDDAGRASFTRR
jgi:hypothetical protein